MEMQIKRIQPFDPIGGPPEIELGVIYSIFQKKRINQGSVLIIETIIFDPSDSAFGATIPPRVISVVRRLLEEYILATEEIYNVNVFIEIIQRNLVEVRFTYFLPVEAKSLPNNDFSHLEFGEYFFAKLFLRFVEHLKVEIPKMEAEFKERLATEGNSKQK